jgi:hypothetical protein
VNVEPDPEGLSTPTSPLIPRARSRLIAKPGPTPSWAGESRVDLDERFEDRVEPVGGDTDAGVPHIHDHRVAHRLAFNPHAPRG